MNKKSSIKNVILNKINKYIFTDINSKISQNSILDKIAKALENCSYILIVKFSLPSKKIVELGQKIRQLCSIFNSLFIIVGRADIAVIVEADGVLLNRNSYSFENAKKILSSDKFFGYLIDNNEEQEKIESNLEFDFFVKMNEMKII